MKAFKYAVVILLLAFYQSSHAFNAADQAKQSSGKDMAGMIASIIGAAMMMPPCMATPPNPAACTMMAQALAQIPASGGAKSGASSAGAAMSVASARTATGPNDQKNELPPLLGGLDPALQDKYKKALDAMKKSGISFKGGGMVLPGGKEVGAGTELSAGGLAALGFSKSDIDKALEVAAQVKIETAGLGGDAGADSVTGKPGGKGTTYTAPQVALATGAKRAAPSLAGLANKFGDDRIGVAADNIFIMMSRRYKNEDGSNGFVKD